MAKGKYAGVIDKLPRSFGTEPDYQAKVNAVKKQIIENHLICGTVSEETATRLEKRFEALLLNASSGDTSETEFITECSAFVHTLLLEFEKLLLLSTGGIIHGSELARVYRDLRGVKDMLEGHVSNINLLIEAHAQMMAEQFEVEGTKSLSLSDGIGGSVRVQYEPQAKVVDRDAFREWCIREGLERQLMLPWQTTNKLTKDALLNGEPEPDGVTAEARAKFVFTKG
jgi:hypothetical protein